MQNVSSILNLHENLFSSKREYTNEHNLHYWYQLPTLLNISCQCHAHATQTIVMFATNATGDGKTDVFMTQF